MLEESKQKNISYRDSIKILCVGGLDPTGGAGITSDILTLSKFGIRGFAIPTALTVQNDREVLGVEPVSAEFFSRQCLFLIKSIPIQGLKIGMIYDEGIFDVLCSIVKRLNIPVVLDPVTESSSGYSLMGHTLRKRIHEIFPYVDLITPNIPESQILCGQIIKSRTDMITAAEILGKRCRGVLIKGGHLEESIQDLLYYEGKFTFFEKKRQNLGKGVHGTGCALSSAIIAHIALGFDIVESVGKSIKWLEKMLPISKPVVDGGYSFLPL